VAVEGEVDTLTAPALKTCVSEQVATLPAHLVLDLESVRFMGAQGLSCLLEARGLVQQNESQLHLAGLVTRAVARPLHITGLLELFSTYPTLPQALAALAE
jgi:anti-sigma B factor antagonist